MQLAKAGRRIPLALRRTMIGLSRRVRETRGNVSTFSMKTSGLPGAIDLRSAD